MFLVICRVVCVSIVFMVVIMMIVVHELCFSLMFHVVEECECVKETSLIIPQQVSLSLFTY